MNRGNNRINNAKNNRKISILRNNQNKPLIINIKNITNISDLKSAIENKTNIEKTRQVLHKYKSSMVILHLILLLKNII